MFKKFTSSLTKKPCMIKAETVTAVVTDQTGQHTIICSNGDIQGFMVTESVEDVIKTLEEK